MPGAPVIFDLTMLAEIVANGMMIDGGLLREGKDRWLERGLQNLRM